jgi:branched-chain amino acid transport system ATP-binding protein
MSSRLEVRDLTVRFGGVLALDQVSFSAGDGRICALIGPNGAGKTTAFNAISRFVRPQQGSITFNGVELLKKPGSAVAALGIARTFQNLSLSAGMSVIDNVMVGSHRRGHVNFITAPLAILNRREERELRSRAYATLDLLGLTALADEPCHGFPYGTLKRIELARALASEPELLLLDEPAGGLTQSEVREFGVLLRRLRDDLRLSLLLVEHHMQLVMDVSDYIVALDFGRNLVEGAPEEVRSDPRLVEAYLGRSE